MSPRDDSYLSYLDSIMSIFGDVQPFSSGKEENSIAKPINDEESSPTLSPSPTVEVMIKSTKAGKSKESKSTTSKSGEWHQDPHLSPGRHQDPQARARQLN